MFYLSILLAHTPEITNKIVQKGMDIASKSCANKERIQKKHFEEFSQWVNKYFGLHDIAQSISSSITPDKEKRKSIENKFKIYIVHYFASPNYLQYLCNYTFDPKETKLSTTPNAISTLFIHKTTGKKIKVVWVFSGKGEIVEIIVDGVKLIFAQRKMALEQFKNKAEEYSKRIGDIVEKNGSLME